VELNKLDKTIRINRGAIILVNSAVTCAASPENPAAMTLVIKEADRQIPRATKPKMIKNIKNRLSAIAQASGSPASSMYCTKTGTKVKNRLDSIDPRRNKLMDLAMRYASTSMLVPNLPAKSSISNNPKNQTENRQTVRIRVPLNIDCGP
jgi:hypothetical protein